MANTVALATTPTRASRVSSATGAGCGVAPDGLIEHGERAEDQDRAQKLPRCTAYQESLRRILGERGGEVARVGMETVQDGVDQSG